MSSRSQEPLARASGNAMAVRLARALPPARTAFVGAALWAGAMSLSAFLGAAHWATASHRGLIVAFFGCGGALAFPLALFVARLLTEDATASRRFAAILLSLALITAGLTALLFALDYRIYHSAGHADAFSRAWAVQLFFTTAGTVYQFAVIGLRLYFPFGVAALVAAGLWFALAAR